MNFRFPNPKLSLLVVLAMVGAAFPVHAQRLRHGQPIVFSSEQEDTVSNAPTPSLLPQAPVLPAFETGTGRGLNIPAPGQAPAAPPVVPTVSAAQMEQMKEAADKQKNWALMTPEEILGVPTPEKVMGVDDKTRHQTTAERYYERQQHSGNAKTNALSTYGRSDRDRDNLRDQDDALLKPSGLFSSAADNADDRNTDRQPFFGGDNSSAPLPGGAPSRMNSIFPSAFGSATPAPVRTPEQLSADAEFQKLLTPHASVSANASPFSSSAPQNSPQPQANPFGNSYTPLNSGIGMPEGIKPLPGLTDQKNSSTTPVNPPWQSPAHLPPWMSQTPQMNTFPRRVDLRQ